VASTPPFFFCFVEDTSPFSSPLWIYSVQQHIHSSSESMGRRGKRSRRKVNWLGNIGRLSVRFFTSLRWLAIFQAVCSINLNAQTYVYTVSVTSVPNDVNCEDYKVRESREVSDIIIPHVDAGHWQALRTLWFPKNKYPPSYSDTRLTFFSNAFHLRMVHMIYLKYKHTLQAMIFCVNSSSKQSIIFG